jgi:class 3 adenylate cyclase
VNTRINKLLHRTPEIEEFIAPLRTSAAPQVRLDQFQIGIDNQHIDAALSHKFRDTLASLSDMVVHEDLVKHGWARMGKSPSNSDFDTFREVYRDIMRGALEQVHKNASMKGRLQLLHLVLLKMLLESPVDAGARLRSKLQQDADSPASANSGRSLELHERMANLARLEPGIRYRALRRIFKVVMRLESKELRKLRKSVVGRSWTVPKQVLFNPLLHLPDLSSEEYFMNHYPILCVDRAEENFFHTTNRILTEVFQNYLPIWAKAVERPDNRLLSGQAGNQPFQIRNRELHSGFSEFLEGQRLLERSLSEEEFKSFNVSWLDTPANMDILLRRPSETSESAGWFSRRVSAGMSPWHNSECDRLQEKLQNEVHKRLERAGITRRAIAAYRTPRLYRQLNGQVPIKEVYLYLAEQLPKKTLSKRLASTADKGVAVIKALDVVLNYIRRMPVAKQQDYATRYVKDFLTFRRDLKLAYYSYQQMSRLRILQDAESIKLSRDNGSLYEFRLGRDMDDESQRTKAHAVLKADVRGSTEITRQLVEKRLNPATHFSMNFFGPITKLLERFGAQKVFVEGDALILAVLETGNVGTQGMTVANTCGLARKILSVMEAQNSQNRAYDLPKLELGLGIAFCSDAPAYLYDERRKIMISPAINQADRLSSCASELRKDTSWRRSRRHRVEVMRYEKGNSGKGGSMLRYNVNGIDLDPLAFNKLKSEMVLHKVTLRSRSGEMHQYHVGRFMDRLGSSHWLVIREAKVKRWDQGKLLDSQAAKAETFYEVITDANIIGRAKEKLSGKRVADVTGTEATEPLF